MAVRGTVLKGTPTTKTKGTLASCSCSECVKACQRNPGWMNPAEAVKAIEAGLAKNLMLDWLDPCSQVGNTEPILVLCPASRHYGGSKAPEWDDMVGGGDLMSIILNPPHKGRCVFLSDKNRCLIHDSGFKPEQCRKIQVCAGDEEREGQPDNYDMGRLWDTEKGRAVVEQWKRAVNFEEEDANG